MYVGLHSSPLCMCDWSCVCVWLYCKHECLSPHCVHWLMATNQMLLLSFFTCWTETEVIKRGVPSLHINVRTHKNRNKKTQCKSCRVNSSYRSPMGMLSVNCGWPENAVWANDEKDDARWDWAWVGLGMCKTIKQEFERFIGNSNKN